MIRIVMLMCIILSLSGCTIINAVIAMNKSTDHFISFEQDSRVIYEAGAETTAKTVADNLAIAIHTIEQKHYRKFTKPVVVHVCSSLESFTAYCIQSRAVGCVLNQRLFLSPTVKHRTAAVLKHELSHLHMEQQLGMLHWYSGVPAWFQEGLAVYVSGGGGAEKVTINEAQQSMVLGVAFTPDTSGSLIFHKSAQSYGLKPHMFYRQASLFVEYLHVIDETRFRLFLLSLEDGEGFEAAISSAYGTPLNKLWQHFILQLKIQSEYRGARSIASPSFESGPTL